ncbi:inosine-5'-monophosphate dehydrogenase [[Clostridium] sordellii]|uniref:Inosine-5'-monophosphate dehydrogenase n=1 Tax=Paraclostridium sordellii TaxID=1505 RepID=A0A9P1P937_PARSO|nr:CBS domain-containing protein [Paeniclostridium sordellii]EPZ57673.1 CBS domain protein [[Clostridium] sordellii VPI 9048] [Paeniclostridium sordellii VPI 9048]MBX9180073.1 CBS domain-containing protein [Paeniclostridium sordellii]MCH1965801.1 CBS domain-containing protein [Paeniclostridium sordellii]MCQ4696375.1 CBS domain-containing protein [Paeniclostridium sordellii]MCR1848736.1 CBS domain-containing protein [Paeniclostridium sordellii]
MNILFFITPKSEVEYLYDYYTIKEAIDKIENNDYTSIPVINEKGQYEFTITEGDLLWKIKSNYENKKRGDKVEVIETLTIKDIDKYNDYKTVSANSNMENLITLATNQNFIPVVDDQNIFIGIIKRSDIIAYFNEKLNLEKSLKIS